MKYIKQFTAILIFIYFYLTKILTTLPLELIGINFNNLSINEKVNYLIAIDLLFIASLYFIFKKDIIYNLIDYTKNFKTYIKKYISYWPIAFGLMIISNIIIMLLSQDITSNNQEAINAQLGQLPLYTIISAVIFAPLIEEVVFRLSFRKTFTNNILYVITSAFIFGALHVVASFDNFIDLLLIIPYSIPGAVFAISYLNSKNIFVPITLHFLHNGFVMTILLVIQNIL